MPKKQINSKKDAVTKPMATPERRKRSYHFPSVGNVEADSLPEALQKAKKKLITNED